MTRLLSRHRGLRSTSHGRLNRIQDARNTSVLGAQAAIRVDDMRSRLAARLVRQGFPSYDVIQYCWANAQPHSDLSNNSVAQWVERNES